jgi:alpha-tubulin suppressor-like RCC1 family protein
LCYGKIGTDACNYPNGLCVAPNQCLCFGFYGEECDIPHALWATGFNDQGQLGLGHTSNRNTFNRAEMYNSALRGINMTSIVGQQKGSFVITSDGRMIGFGINTNYELADLTTTRRETAIDMLMLGLLASKRIKQIASSLANTHNLAVTEDGMIFAWGKNNNGQVGDGSTLDRDLPARVTALENHFVIQTTAGNGNSFALTAEGKIFAWGYGGTGSLGVGDTNNYYLPTQVYTDGVLKRKSIVKISCKYNHMLALSSDGKIYAWGENTNGKLGDGTTATRTLPVAVIMDGFEGKKSSRYRYWICLFYCNYREWKIVFMGTKSIHWRWNYIK